MQTIFDEIIADKENHYIVWEDSNHIAFLTPYPNTPGLTVVIPKKNFGDYAFRLTDDQYSSLMLATKHVANILEKALNVPRVALVFEGTGVAYVHAKLYPLYGEQAFKTGVWSDYTEFSKEYRKYLTTVEGPRMDSAELKKIQTKILAVQDY
jgi:diadenosine tetraphosphate (Ap4A) HIT family hydrolase